MAWYGPALPPWGGRAGRGKDGGRKEGRRKGKREVKEGEVKRWFVELCAWQLNWEGDYGLWI